MLMTQQNQLYSTMYANESVTDVHRRLQMTIMARDTDGSLADMSERA